MNFQVLSREKAKRFSYKPDINNCIIISITDVFSPSNQFAANSHIKGICRVKFDDVEFGEPNCITSEDSQRIINFVNDHINDIDEIIVHCEAGVSRSAGVCAALMQIINGDDSPIFDNPKFCPNMSCYRSVMETYYGTYNKKCADEKTKHNIDVWRNEHGLE